MSGGGLYHVHPAMDEGDESPGAGLRHSGNSERLPPHPRLPLGRPSSSLCVVSPSQALGAGPGLDGPGSERGARGP